MRRSIPLDTARRLAVSAALLDAPRPAADVAGILAVVERLGRLQLDPTRAVEYSHLLVLWSRLGPFERSALDRLLWEERRLFEHAAFIVPVESYPWQRERMRRWASGPGAWRARARDWLIANEPLRRHILERIGTEGGLPARAFTPADGVVPWRSSGWQNERNVVRMLESLGARGEILVARRAGRERWWDLADRVLPPWTPRAELDPTTLTARWIERIVRRLGIAERREIAARVPVAGSREVGAEVDSLLAGGRLVGVQVDPPANYGRDGAYLAADDMAILERLEQGAWAGRTTLLSPFDPLIKDRERTERLFGFRYRMEIYVPREERRYGYFTMPVLDADRLVARIDPRMDRRSGRLTIHAIHPEASVTIAGELRRRTEGSIAELAHFLGASEVVSPWGTMRL